MSNSHSLQQVLKKMESYCAYQERCHQEVEQKLYSLHLSPEERDSVIVHLIENNFLNESRFACSFARGKHRIKKWGKIRISNELKARQISTYNINLSLKEITEEEYWETFENLAIKTWERIFEKNDLKKRKKFCDALLRKGYQSDWIYEKVKSFEMY